MKIGELVKQTGLTASRIRFYEASGLLKAVERQANGYRDYPPEAVWILEIIAGAQGAGFSLEEIRHLLPMGTEGWKHDELLTALKRKLADIDAMQARLTQTRAQLLVAIAGIENKPEGLACAANGQRVLGMLREG
ncbi:MAG TPA: MerR family transcriptional regulator [Moraxellaceae bacterium]